MKACPPPLVLAINTFSLRTERRASLPTRRPEALLWPLACRSRRILPPANVESKARIPRVLVRERGESDALATRSVRASGSTHRHRSPFPLPEEDLDRERSMPTLPPSRSPIDASPGPGRENLPPAMTDPVARLGGSRFGEGWRANRFREDAFRARAPRIRSRTRAKRHPIHRLHSSSCLRSIRRRSRPTAGRRSVHVPFPPRPLRRAPRRARCARAAVSLRGWIRRAIARFGSARTIGRTSRRVRRTWNGRARDARRRVAAGRLVLRLRTVRLERDGRLLLKRPRKTSKP